MPIPESVGAFAIVPHNELSGAILSGSVLALAGRVAEGSR
jgi:hypothetical protein